jgi:glycosyltransferase involved in cell wall biosynthesis
MLVTIGILAHNEAGKIAALISDLGKQTLLANDDFWIDIHVVANGCTDATIRVANSAFAVPAFQRGNTRVFIQNIERAGKSNAWNEFVHELASPKTDFIFFLDADIRIPEDTTLRLMLDRLVDAKKAYVAVNKSVKDLSEQAHKTVVEGLVLAASGAAYDNRTSLAGALYCARFKVLKDVWMPIGLPEDGFLWAMILTSNFTKDENLDRIIYVDTARHIFASKRTIMGVFRHNIRLAIGTAMNVLVFKHIRASSDIQRDVGGYIRQRNMADANWINELIANETKEGRYFLLNKGFFSKRLHRLASFPLLERLRKFPITIVGFAFDLTLFFTANRVMRRGLKAGYR